MFKSACDKLFSKWMDSLRLTQETFLHYSQTLCRVDFLLLCFDYCLQVDMSEP